MCWPAQANTPVQVSGATALFEVAPVDRDVLQRALDDDGFGYYEDAVAHAGVLPHRVV
jgi:hypothetical protein